MNSSLDPFPSEGRGKQSHFRTLEQLPHLLTSSRCNTPTAQLYHEATSSPLTRHARHFSTVMARDVAHQCQSKSHTAVSFLGAGRPIERLEDTLEFLFGDPSAAVAHQDPQRTFLR